MHPAEPQRSHRQGLEFWEGHNPKEPENKHGMRNGRLTFVEWKIYRYFLTQTSLLQLLKRPEVLVPHLTYPFTCSYEAGDCQ